MRFSRDRIYPHLVSMLGTPSLSTRFVLVVDVTSQMECVL